MLSSEFEADSIEKPVPPEPEPIEEDCETTVISPEYENTIHTETVAIDLGLNVKWSSCNIGAKRPSSVGGYYGWADITGRVVAPELKFYPNSTPPEDICGDSEYDIAKHLLGGKWRLPTKQEQDELRLRCDWEWMEQDNVEGYLITGPNGNSIFLPCAGFRTDMSMRQQGIAGYYWSGELYDLNHDEAFFLYFDENGRKSRNTRRYFGMSIRPVCDK